MTNREIEKVLSTIERLMELHGENAFRSRAYGRAARAIRSSTIDVAARIAEGSDLGIDGIGAGLTAEIGEILETGTSSGLEDLLERTPNGLLDVLQIRGLGSKKVRTLWTELGIESIDDLERSARAGAVSALKGFGAKTEQNILSGIQELRSNLGKVRLHTATILAEDLVALLSALDSVSRVEPTGRLRRGAEVFSLLEFLLVVDDPKALLAELDRYDEVEELKQKERTILFGFRGESRVRLHLSDDASWPVDLHQTTGSSDYLFMFSIPFEKRGYRFEEGRVLKDREPVTVAGESDLFELAGMQQIPPELREGIDEVTNAIDGVVPKLVRREDLRGVLHVHSTWSDGRNSVGELAEAARARGFAYLLMCDHSKAAFYANGLDERRLEEQGREIDRVNEKYDPAEFRVLKGIECDILSDGSLDLADDALAALDCVVISVHSSFTLEEEAQTDRICRALEHPAAGILAHPTGRLLLTRKGYRVDLQRVIAHADEFGKFVELNANPYRLDLDWRMLRYARRRGVLVGIDPDAHAVGELDYVDYGIRMARKAGLEAKDVLNALDADTFLRTVASSGG